MPNYLGELNPGEGMSGRWMIGHYTTIDGKRRLTNRGQDGALTNLPDQIPSDAVLPEPLRKALDTYLSADSDLELAKDERNAVHSDAALKQAQQHDTQRIVDLATSGKSEEEFGKEAKKSPNEDELRVKRRVAEAKMAAAIAPQREAFRAVLAAFNDAEIQAELKATVDSRLSEAETAYADAEAAFNRAKGALQTAQQDRHATYIYVCDEMPARRDG